MANMRRLRAEIVQQAESIILKADGENRGLTDDERTKLVEMRAQISRLDEDIRIKDEWNGLAAETRATTPPTRPEPEAETEKRALWRDVPTPPAPTQREQEYRFGQFLQAVMRSSRPGSDIDPLVRTAYEQRAATGLNETVASDGGFLVGADFSAELLRRAYTMGEITNRCRRIPISAGSNSLKINGVDETSRAAGSRWGGIRGYWLAEAGLLTSSKPKFREIELKLNKLGVLAYSTDELLQDAGALGSILMDAASEEIMFMTENSIINGTGAGMPLGVLNANATVSQTKETGQATSTLVAENVMKMRSRMWARSRGNSVWLISQDVEPQLHGMTKAVGTGGVPVYLPASGLAGGPFDTLYGRPVIPVEYCPTLGTVGDVIYADFSQYLLADKGGIQSASSIHVQFLYDETVFRFIYRVDGQPIWNAALTPANGSSNTLSPFVTVATRA